MLALVLDTIFRNNKYLTSVDSQCLHTPVKMAGFSNEKKKEPKINHIRSFPTSYMTYQSTKLMWKKNQNRNVLRKNKRIRTDGSTYNNLVAQLQTLLKHLLLVIPHWVLLSKSTSWVNKFILLVLAKNCLDL